LAPKAAQMVVGFLAGFLALNTYWGLGGTAGVAWVLGCECTVPLAAVWAQEAAIVAGIGIVLGKAEIWRGALPSWIFGVGIWAMTASFAAVGLQNELPPVLRTPSLRRRWSSREGCPDASTPPTGVPSACRGARPPA